MHDPPSSCSAETWRGLPGPGRMGRGWEDGERYERLTGLDLTRLRSDGVSNLTRPEGQSYSRLPAASSAVSVPARAGLRFDHALRRLYHSVAGRAGLGTVDKKVRAPGQGAWLVYASLLVF